ncbi:MAG: hypothetical protein K0Q55_3786 [Verrucomicrobia bacterium]|jgi:hypothetical protein|nr:hypothetical protein [Verrucomicrobiota bacterium]
MKYLIYGLTGLVLVCDLLFIALIALAMAERDLMILMFAPLVIYPSLFASALIVFLLNRTKLLLASNKGIYRFNAASFFGIIILAMWLS